MRALTWGWRLIKATAAMGVLWLVLTEGELGGVLGAATVVAAGAAGVALAGRRIHPWSPGGVLRFSGYFIGRSFLGGLDVAWRALHPGGRLAPVWIEHPLRLPAGEPRVVMLAAISLLPGTLAADVDGDTLLVHALMPQAEAEIGRLEQRVAAVYGIGVQPS